MRPNKRRGIAGIAARNIEAAPAKRPLSGRTVLLWLLAFFGVVIGINTVMIALAIGTMPGLETEKPYQAGVSYYAEIEAARARRL